MRVPYPRTPHLPWSPGASPDDVRTGDLSGLRGTEVVVTEKLDGENTTLYRDGLHARSLDSAHHPSRAWVKGLQGRIGAAIPPGWRVCGRTSTRGTRSRTGGWRAGSTGSRSGTTGTAAWTGTGRSASCAGWVHAVARRRDALVTHVVALVDEEELARRNAGRTHPVPPRVLAAQLRRFVPPYPGQAHRTWYVGAGGTVDDADGALGGTGTPGGPDAPGGVEW